MVEHEACDNSLEMSNRDGTPVTSCGQTISFKAAFLNAKHQTARFQVSGVRNDLAEYWNLNRMGRASFLHVN
jgi:diaminopimelate epimerase